VAVHRRLIYRPGVEYAELYRTGRTRTVELGRTLPPAEVATRVPGCPEWTVKDVYAHLSGVAADALAGRLEGVATDPWTKRQVDARVAMPLSEILDEWERNGPIFDELLAGGGPPQLVIDTWTHEQDLRAALDRPAHRDDALVRFAVQALVGRFVDQWPALGHPPVVIEGESGRWELGALSAAAAITLRASDFELARGLLGRRSRAQMLAWDWRGGDPEPFIADLVVFAFASEDQKA
jgi:uncharacterized protein (TIGR03083 family)